jgi:DNA ligase-1
MVLDGELYIHGVDFDSLASWTKKKYPETPTLEYHVYDMPLNEMGGNEIWTKRYQNMLQFFFKNCNLMKMVKLVSVYGYANNNQEVLDWEEKCVEDGYEGCMFRNRTHMYLFGGIHCNSLLKVKSSVDGEYKIVGFDHGKGKYANCVKWNCVTPEGLEFDVNPKATIARKEQLFKEAKKYIGEWLKVRYQNLSEKDKKPRFPRGLGFRDKRDM